MIRARPAAIWLAATVAVTALAMIAIRRADPTESPTAPVVPAKAAPPPSSAEPPVPLYPSAKQVQGAAQTARGRGSVAFAVLGAKGGVRGLDRRRQFSSASVSKVLMLAAFLRGHKRLTASDRSLLSAMIRFSDNKAADAIYARVGDDGMRAVARRADMRDFEVTPGFWGGAQITAADLARFFFRLERNLGRRHRAYGMRLLARVTRTQRWGIPAAAGRAWRVWFKGGWRPGGHEQTSGPVAHQGALLERGQVRLGLAVLTEGEPGYGFETIEQIASRLLNPAPPGDLRRWPSA